MALEPGQTAPEVRLLDAHTGEERAAAWGTLTLLAFVKHNCPVCQMAAPYISRFGEFAGQDFQVLAIAEDPAGPAVAFAEEHGLHVPLALDQEPYPVSDAFGLTNVPTLFLVEPGGRIARAVVKQDKAGYNELASEVAARTGRPAAVVVHETDAVPEFRPG